MKHKILLVLIALLLLPLDVPWAGVLFWTEATWVQLDWDAPNAVVYHVKDSANNTTYFDIPDCPTVFLVDTCDIVKVNVYSDVCPGGSHACWGGSHAKWTPTWQAKLCTTLVTGDTTIYVGGE